MDKEEKRAAISIFIVFMISAFLAFNSEGFRRNIKTFFSSQSGGINRTLTVYDYNGNPIKSWTGKFDIDSNTGETFFDIGNKRVIIRGGIVISEEDK